MRFQSRIWKKIFGHSISDEDVSAYLEDIKTTKYPNELFLKKQADFDRYESALYGAEVCNDIENFRTDNEIEVAVYKLVSVKKLKFPPSVTEELNSEQYDKLFEESKIRENLKSKKENE